MLMNRSNMVANQTPQFRVLSREQCEEIHLATLEVLERTGVRVENARALGLLLDAGAHVRDGDVVTVPSHLVKRALATAPPRVAISNRRGERAMLLEGHRVYFGTMSSGMTTQDPYTGETRRLNYRDCVHICRVTDALENIDFMSAGAMIYEVPNEFMDREKILAALTNSVKPIVVCASDKETLGDVIEMGAIVRGGREAFAANPFIIHNCEPITPLTHADMPVENLLICAEQGIPNVYYPMPLAGASTPATFAANMVVGNAEVLSGLVIAQLAKPGSPFIAGGIHSIMDMLQYDLADPRRTVETIT